MFCFLQKFLEAHLASHQYFWKTKQVPLQKMQFWKEDKILENQQQDLYKERTKVYLNTLNWDKSRRTQWGSLPIRWGILGEETWMHCYVGRGQAQKVPFALDVWAFSFSRLTRSEALGWRVWRPWGISGSEGSEPSRSSGTATVGESGPRCEASVTSFCSCWVPFRLRGWTGGRQT